MRERLSLSNKRSSNLQLRPLSVDSCLLRCLVLLRCLRCTPSSNIPCRRLLPAWESRRELAGVLTAVLQRSMPHFFLEGPKLPCTPIAMYQVFRQTPLGMCVHTPTCSKTETTRRRGCVTRLFGARRRRQKSVWTAESGTR